MQHMATVMPVIVVVSGDLNYSGDSGRREQR